MTGGTRRTAAKPIATVGAPIPSTRCCDATSVSERTRRHRGPAPTTTDAAGNVRRSVGWEYVHIAIDDHSRLAYAEVLPNEKATTAAGFLSRAVAFYARFGITVERLLTDNGACYRSILHALACRRLGIRHLRTRPYRPQTNEQAERFIRTLLAGWAYDHRRRHSALGHQPPASRTNLLGSYS